MKRKTFFIVFLFLLGLPHLACKAGNPITSGISPAIPAYTAEDRPSNVTSRYVSLRESSVNGGRIFLDLVVTEVDEPVTGIAIKLTYPDLFSKFIGCTNGDLFLTGACFSSEPSPGSGEVFIGRSITMPSEATTVSGDRVVVRLEFLVFGEGADPIVIEGQNLGGGDVSALLDVNGDPIFVNWYSGTLRGE